MYWKVIYENVTTINWGEIINSPAVSATLGAVMGATVGGVITGMLTIYNFKKQEKIQREQQLLKKRNEEIVAFKLINEELKYNNMRLKSYLKQYEKFGDQFLEHAEQTKILLFPRDKWLKYEEIIVRCEEFKSYHTINFIYVNLLQCAQSGVIMPDHAKNLMQDIIKVSDLINKYLEGNIDTIATQET